MTILDNLIKYLQELQSSLNKQIVLEQTETEDGKKFGEFCIQSLGKNFTTNKMYGCAETINRMAQICLGHQIGGGLSTYLMFEELKRNCIEVARENLKLGDIIISPTGYGKKDAIGHVGVYIGENKIASNNSLTGLLDTYYTLDSWYQRYVVGLKFPMKYYRLKVA